MRQDFVEKLVQWEHLVDLVTQVRRDNLETLDHKDQQEYLDKREILEILAEPEILVLQVGYWWFTSKDSSLTNISQF